MNYRDLISKKVSDSFFRSAQELEPFACNKVVNYNLMVDEIHELRDNADTFCSDIRFEVLSNLRGENTEETHGGSL